MTGPQRTRLVLLSVVQIGLAAAAWTDLARRAPENVRGPRWRWALVIGVNFVGPVAYFRWGRRPQPANAGSIAGALDYGPGTA
ncbi:MAG: PLDc N-terminal domain-containing protein [Acidimicrobiales bacterium]